MKTLKELKQELATAQAERTMCIRYEETTDEVDVRIARLKKQIANFGATVAEVNAAGRFAKDDEVTQGQLDVRDTDLMSNIGDMSKWTMQHPWR